MGRGKIPLGARVKHRTKGYVGWLAGWKDDRRVFEGHKTNPDEKTQCRIYTHLDHTYRYAAEEDLEVCNDLEEALDRTKLNVADGIFIGSEDFSQLPIPCLIWSLGPYHARPLIKSSRAKDLTHTNRINDLKREWEHDGWIF